MLQAWGFELRKLAACGLQLNYYNTMTPAVYLIQTPPFWLKTPPLGILYVKNYLTQKGVDCGIIDVNKELFLTMKYSISDWLTLNQSFEENLFAKTESTWPDTLENVYRTIEPTPYVGFSLFKRNRLFALSLAERIAERFPSKKIIFGGPETLFLDWHNKLDSRYHWVIGEGEIPLHEMLNDTTKPIRRFQEIKNLDSLPFLDFDAFDLTRYAHALPLLSSRGCTYTCNFCSEKKLYKKFRHHSALYVAEHINHLSKKYRLRNFIFCDSLINYDNHWLADFCSALIKKDLTIQWEAQVRIDDTFSLELGRLMKKSGCYNLFVGLESACDKTLRTMHKGFNITAALDFFRKLRDAGLQFEISLIFGYPGETYHDFKETLNFIKKNKKLIPKIAQANPFVDYMNDFPALTLPNEETHKRIVMFLSMLKEERIRYTRSYIGNLIYR